MSLQHVINEGFKASLPVKDSIFENCTYTGPVDTAGRADPNGAYWATGLPYRPKLINPAGIASWLKDPPMSTTNTPARTIYQYHILSGPLNAETAPDILAFGHVVAVDYGEAQTRALVPYLKANPDTDANKVYISVKVA